MKKFWLVLCLVWPAALLAVPQSLDFQGFLSDGPGLPIDGDVSLTVRLYAAPDDADPAWSQTGTVSVVQGLFQVVLDGSAGGDNPFPAGLLDGALWLGVEVGDDGEMAPRRPLAAAPYSLKARDAERLGGLTASDLQCNRGDFVQCFTAPRKRLGVGECRAGTRYCGGDGWSACEGEVTPQAEVCGDSLDNDCDGQADEGCVPPDGTPCDDGNACTMDDAYAGGVCAGGAPLVCTSTNPCLVPRCEPSAGCVAVLGGDGAPCGSQSSSQCNAPDTCQSGVCVSNIAPSGSACGSQSQSFCDGPDTCQGGVCRPNNRPNGLSCPIGQTTGMCFFGICDPPF